MALVGEIRMFGGSHLPPGWLACDGSVLPTRKYVKLYQVIGNRYGGDGLTTFALPNLTSAAADHGGVQFIIAAEGRVVRHKRRAPAATQQARHDAMTAVVPASEIQEEDGV